MSLSSHLLSLFTSALGLSFFLCSKFSFTKAPVNLVFFALSAKGAIFFKTF